MVRKNNENHRHIANGQLPELLTVQDLVLAFQISKKAIYSYARIGVIPYVRLGRNMRFPKKEILEWLETKTFRPRTYGQ